MLKRAKRFSLLFFLLSTISIVYVPKVFAADCPAVDGGSGDSDGVADGTITIGANTTWAANEANLGSFDCSTKNIVVNSGFTLTLSPSMSNDDDDTNDFGVTVQANSFTIEGTITANNLGYPAQKGPGKGGDRTSGYGSAGAGHGGVGGDAYVATGGPIYGSITSPTTLGSGGGYSSYGGVAGAGGGAFKLISNNDMVINGTVSANGQAGTEFRGGGSGGSIWIQAAGNFSGSGTVSVAGGAAGSRDGHAASGAGGRAVVEFTSQTGNSVTINNAAGTGARVGEKGTALMIDTDDHHLYIKNSQKWYPDATTTFEDWFSTITDLTITNNATLSLDSANKTADDTSGYGWNFELENITIDAGSAISTNYLGAEARHGAGKGGDIVSHYGGAGGGHGGTGGNGLTSTGGITYGSYSAPITIGSGGGKGSNTSPPGAGGGAIKLSVNNNLINNGTITSNGQAGTEFGGGGSGGSIWLNVFGTLSGTGSITAIGGNGGTRDGHAASGGGGRISIISGTNTFSGAISYAGGAGARPGSPGTLNTETLPSNPTDMTQYQNDGITVINTGSNSQYDSMILSVTMADPNLSPSLYAEFEVQQVGTTFTNSASYSTDPISYSGTDLTGTVTVTGLSDATNYHWQARVCNNNDSCSAWSSYGNNTENETDFGVSLNQPPNAPSSLSPSSLLNAGFSADSTPTFQFALSDPDVSNQVKYRIQISTTEGDFSSPLIDYTSTLQDQGSASFTVGQSAGSGTYNVGQAGDTLSEGSYYWRIQAIDSNDATSSWAEASGTPAFTIDLTLPTLETSTRQFQRQASASAIIDFSNPVWTNGSSPVFTWATATDSGGSSIKGYCLYLGTDDSADPGSQKGLLGSSPVSTTGTDCQFITNTNTIDLSNTAYRGSSWLSSSDSAYYLLVKAIDNAGNRSSSQTTIPIYFDNTPPTNTTAISAASGSFSSISDMYFNWPTAAPQAAVDNHSGILGYQYAFNSPSNWIGTQTDSTTGLDYIPPAYTQPFYISNDYTSDDLILGANTVYFRTIDVAGNPSTVYASATLNYGGEAPSFAFDASLTVTPTTNTENKFALSWSEANPADGRTIEKYYYMINTQPPASYSTITQNTATYIQTTETSVASAALSGVRKGSNTVYVVAVDDNDNYSPSNYVTATFTLNSSSPDPAQNLTVADSSVKEASIWRASLAWSAPDYKGTGDITYIIQRSDDGETWTTVTTTTGTAYVDTVAESKQYYWRIGTRDTSEDSINSPSYTNAVTLTPKGAFTAPADLSSGPAASSITTKRATISWTTSRTSDSKVAFGTSSEDYLDEEIYNSTHTTDHSLKLTNLEPGTTYYYVTKWTDEDGNTGESEEKTFTTSPAPTVQDIEVTNVGLSSAIIKFTTTNATQAKIYYGESTDFGGAKTVSTSTLESTYTVEINELQDNTKYYFKINTFDQEEAEYEGSILDFTTLPRPRISNVRIQQVKDTAQSALSVTWESNTEISSIVTYYPESNPEFAQDEVDVKLTSDQHEMIITGLLPDTVYYLTVSGRDKIGNEAISDTLKFTTASDTRPPEIIDLVVEGTSVSLQPIKENPSQLIVSWNTDEPATSQVEYGEGTGENYSQLTQEDSDYSYNHVVVINNLSPARVYHLRVISRDLAGNEAKSIDTVTITPKATDNALDLVITNLRQAFGFLAGVK